MKIFANTKIIKKIAIILLIILLFNFIIPKTIVFAVPTSWLARAGGNLLSVILDFLMFIGDGVMNILQNNFISTDKVIVEATAQSLGGVGSVSAGNWLKIGIGVLLVVIAVAVAVASAGTLSAASVAAIGGAINVIGGVVLAGGAGTILAISGIVDAFHDFRGDFDLPMIRYTPYEIFSNQIPLFDVNFVNPNPGKIEEREGFIDEGILIGEGSSGGVEGILTPERAARDHGYEYPGKEEDGYPKHFSDGRPFGGWNAVIEWKMEDNVYRKMEFWRSGTWVNCFWRVTEHTKTGLVPTKEYKSSAEILQKSISTWYTAFRRIAIVVELSMLVYVGIKIILASASDKKAKYKRFFVDWLVALCLLFILHYIMVFLVTFSQEISKIFLVFKDEGSGRGRGEYNIVVDLPMDTRINLKKSQGVILDGEKLISADAQVNDGNIVGTSGTLPPKWSCSFIGYMRLQAGIYDKVAGHKNLAYAIIYLVLVVYTVMFTFIYIKRVLYMAFLTMIAPLIAVTYPIDKMKDQKAQAYGLWIKEYTYNALIQPVHLIIYGMLISNVMQTVEAHPIYALIATGFLFHGEKLIREMFGFNKATTVGALTKAAGGAAIMSAVNKMSNLNERKMQESEEDKISHIRTASEQKYKLPPISTTPSSSREYEGSGSTEDSDSTGNGSAGGSSTGRKPANAHSPGFRQADRGVATGQGLDEKSTSRGGDANRMPTGRSMDDNRLFEGSPVGGDSTSEKTEDKTPDDKKPEGKNQDREGIKNEATADLGMEQQAQGRRNIRFRDGTAKSRTVE